MGNKGKGKRETGTWIYLLSSNKSSKIGKKGKGKTKREREKKGTQSTNKRSDYQPPTKVQETEKAGSDTTHKGEGPAKPPTKD